VFLLPNPAAESGKADIAKPMHGVGSGVFEIALPFLGDGFRVVYAVQLADEIWVVPAFQKKSRQGIKTPQREIDLIQGPRPAHSQAAPSGLRLVGGLS
jgi:phage-related protein